MANVKNGAYREIIIDQCLQSRRGYSTMEIFERVNNALLNKGEAPVNSLNTIRNDILSIENRWNVIVESLRNGREIRYRYENPDFSIFNSPLNQGEIEQLIQAVSVLRRFEGMPGFEWVDELNARLKTTVNASAQPVVEFQENELLKGMHWFSPLFKYITERQVLNIGYESFNGKFHDNVIHPFFLKQYNQRWFLFGLNERYKTISNMPLDRIKSIQKSDMEFKENTTVDFKHYFDNVIGVTLNPKIDVELIVLHVDAEQIPYIISKPIHKSQLIHKNYEDGSAKISIKVAPNYELVQLLLSFGEHIKVLSPERLRSEIQHRIEKNFNNYK